MELEAEQVPFDSKEAMEYAMRYAKAHKLVLPLFYEMIAKKHGVPTEGVIFARHI